MSGCNSPKCCCGISRCYQRWTVRWYCETGLFDDVVAGDKTCFAGPPLSGWHRYDVTDTYCDYEIYVPLGADCSEDVDCADLPDTDPPDPFGCDQLDDDGNCVGPAIAADGTGVPRDCCCPCLCCSPEGTELTATVDSSAMIPTPPAGGWYVVTPPAPGDWHSYLGAPDWVAHPQTVFHGGVTMPFGSGVGIGINCDTQPTTQPAGQPVGGPTVPVGYVLPCDPAGPSYSSWSYLVLLTCDGPDAGDTYTVQVLGSSIDDVFTDVFGPYLYGGTVSGVALTCVDGRPTGTAVVPMLWDSSDLNFNPAGVPQDCGSLTVVFA